MGIKRNLDYFWILGQDELDDTSPAFIPKRGRKTPMSLAAVKAKQRVGNALDETSLEDLYPWLQNSSPHVAVPSTSHFSPNVQHSQIEAPSITDYQREKQVPLNKSTSHNNGVDRSPIIEPTKPGNNLPVQRSGRSTPASIIDETFGGAIIDGDDENDGDGIDIINNRCASTPYSSFD